MTNPLTQNNRRRGNALVELAVTVPFLFLLTMGAADFGRLFYHARTPPASPVSSPPMTTSTRWITPERKRWR